MVMPLDGIRIIDWTLFQFGPVATSILGDLGADVMVEAFLHKAEEVDADLICLSALLTTTMLGQKRFIQELEKSAHAGRFKVMVGGAPVNQMWANDIGADGYAENAMTAVRAALGLLSK